MSSLTPQLGAAVIGAGPHGVTVGTALAERLGRDAVCLLDPHAQPLAAWSSRAAAIGMRQMRSPWVHHCSTDPADMRRFAGVGLPRMSEPPPVAVFEAHALDRAERSGLEHRCVWVVRLERRRDGWAVHLHGGEVLHADRVVLAGGLDAHRRDALGGLPLPDTPLRDHAGRIAVVGAGHTGASAALHVLQRGGRVDLFAARGLRERRTDVEPGWFGPKHLRAFDAAPPARRRQQLREARVGTTTPAVAGRLRKLRACGRFRLVTGRVATVSGQPGERHVTLADGTVHGPYEAVYTATGYDVSLTREPLLAGLELPTCEGLPLLDEHLQALPGLHLTGPLAELELGPAGRNLWGAQRAARRIAAAADAATGAQAALQASSPPNSGMTVSAMRK